jgi:hypothetical protein
VTATRAEKKKGRKKKNLARTVGPSRIHNKRQQKLIKMVEGYESTITMAAMVRNTMVIWSLYSLVLIATGFTTLSASDTTTAGRRAIRMAEAIRNGSGLLFVITIIITVAWLSRCRMNVKHLGKSPKIGVWLRLKSHVGAAVLGGFTLLMALLSPGNATLFVMLTAGLWVYASLWLQFLMLDTVRMLWRTSSPPTPQEEDLPHYAFAWIVSWVLFSSTIGLEEGVDLTSTQLAPLSIFSGITCLVASATMARLVMAVSTRQDRRLEAIITDNEDFDATLTPVTTSQIAKAWNDSENLIELPGRR